MNDDLIWSVLRRRYGRADETDLARIEAGDPEDVRRIEEHDDALEDDFMETPAADLLGVDIKPITIRLEQWN